MFIHNDLISIIIPCFNSEKYLAETIDSVICQSHGNWECIIVDDGSEDSSFMIALSYKERHPDKICVFRNKGKGACAARNYGIELSKGEYIKFLDSDDALFCNETLKNQLQFLKDNDFEIVYGDEFYYQNDLNDFGFLKKRGAVVNDAKSFYKNFPITSNFLISKKALGTIRWNNKLKSGQEFFLLFQCFTRGYKFGYQLISVSKIRIHDSKYRISNKSKEKHIQQLLDLVEEMKTEVDTLAITDKDFLQQFKIQLLTSSYQAIKYGDNEAAEVIQKHLSKVKNVKFNKVSANLLYTINSISPYFGSFMYRLFTKFNIEL